MSTEALRKAVESAGHYLSIERSGNVEFVRLNKSDWDTIVKALHDQEAEIARRREQAAMSMGVGTGDGQLFVYGSYESIKAAQAIVFRAEQAESALATHRANYDALVLRLGEVTERLEAAEGTLREIRDSTFRSAVMLRAMADRHLSTHLKAADHG